MNCVGFKVFGFDVQVCSDEGGGYHAVGSFAGFELQTVSFTPSGDTGVALFSIPGLGGAGTKIELQVLRQDRADGTDFSTTGDVRGRYWQWNPLHSLDCMIPSTGELGSHCWEGFNGSEQWHKLGRL